MKAAFGLAGLLITIGIIVWLMSISLGRTSDALRTNKQINETMKPMAGINPDGGRIADTISLEPFKTPDSSKTTGLLVARIEPENVLASRYGLRQYDVITKVGPIPVEQDPGTAEAMVLEAAGRGYPLSVTRGNDHLTLPQPAGAAPPGGRPAAAPGSGQGALQRQLEGIQKIPTH